MINAVIPYVLNEVRRVCEFQYDGKDPYAVTLVFTQPSPDGEYGEVQELTWTVGRDLLFGGLDSEKWLGQGDVRVRRDAHSQVTVRFFSREEDEKIADVVFSFNKLRQFLWRTERIVARGKESNQIDWDEFDSEREEWERP